MAMSSYLINSNYVDPKFPPCEEYSQSDYLTSHSPDYYSAQRQDPSFQHESIYHQRSRCADPPLLIVPGSGAAYRGHLSARSRSTHNRTLDPSPRTKPSLRLGNSEPSACLRSDSH